MDNGFDSDQNVFEIVSGKMIVTDPCYEPEGSYVLFLDVKKGMWTARTSEEEGRISEIECQCIGQYGGVWDLRSEDIGVDSGQAGFFDLQFYNKDEHIIGLEKSYIYDGSPLVDVNGTWHSDTHWYNFCCDRTLGPDGWGVVPYGAVGSSGWGDGCYKCYTKANSDKEIIAVKIVFIEEQEEEEYSCWECGRILDYEGQECERCSHHCELCGCDIDESQTICADCDEEENRDEEEDE